MFVEIKSRLQDVEISELLDYAVFAEEDKLSRTIEQYQSNSKLEIYGYEAEGEIIGILGMEVLEKSILHILHLSIHPDYRGLGYGRGVLMEMIEWKKPVQLIAETDEESVDFYRNIGFTIVSLGELYPGVERFHCVYHTNDV